MQVGWESVRAPHACGGTEGHVHVGPQLRQHALLPVPAAELVADHRIAVQAVLYRGVRGRRVPPRPDDAHLADDRRLLPLQLLLLHFACTRSQTPCLLNFRGVVCNRLRTTETPLS